MWLWPCRASADRLPVVAYRGVAMTTMIEPGMALPTTEDRGGSLMCVGRNATAVGTGMDSTGTATDPSSKVLVCTSSRARTAGVVSSAAAAAAKTVAHSSADASAPIVAATILAAATTLAVGRRSAAATFSTGLSGGGADAVPSSHSNGPHRRPWTAACATKMARA